MGFGMVGLHMKGTHLVELLLSLGISKSQRNVSVSVGKAPDIKVPGNTENKNRD